MPLTYIRRAAVALSVLVLTAAGCTVKDSQAPALTGPSGLALTLNLNAIPDSLSQDGGSQSSVKVTAIGPDGRPQSGVPLRVDMMVGGVAQDYGSLSARSIVTNSDGVATVIYTAPPGPSNGVFGTCNSLPGNCVSIVATATGTNFATANPQQVQIRLVPTGIILPPASQPTAAFTMSPTTALANVPVIFDASNSTPGTGASSISSYSWNFGDGTSGTGSSVSHTFTSQQTFNVSLTVTNDRGLSATTTVPVGVGALAAPILRVVFSPAGPTAGQSISFNAEQSTAAPGHTITSFSWNFGDGATATGFLATHTYTASGTYNVVLSAIDDTGQRATTSVSVSVTSGGGIGGGATTASYVASPTAPVVGQVVFFNASGSTAATGRTLTKYAWDFGDGTSFTGTTASASHTFTTTGTFTVVLVVTDDTGQTAKFTGTVTVASAGANLPTADFQFSPAAPVVGQQIVFDASTATAATGLTLSDYAWVFGDGTPAIHTTSKTIAHSYAFVGTFSVSLTVTDNVGGTKSVAKTVPVIAGGTPPTANFTFSPAVGVAGQNVAFNGTSSFAGAGAITSYTWNFGDGSALDNTSGANVNHTFVRGTFSVTLTVTQTNGLTGTVSKTIVVQ